MNQWWISVMIVVLLSAVINGNENVSVRQSNTGCKNPNGTINCKLSFSVNIKIDDIYSSELLSIWSMC